MNLYNRNLLVTILLLWIVVGLKLYTTAIATDNMRGFAYSMLHVVIVGAGTFLALRKSEMS